MLICADSRAALAEIEEGSVQCCITSPPYWSLRRYGDAAEMVFGGDAGCEHEWGQHIVNRRGAGGEREYGSSDSGVGRGPAPELPSSNICSLCGCWRGQFGLEPTPEMYVEHMLDFLRAIWRVLRDDGTLWLNLGDSYASQGGAKTEASYASAGTGNSANRTLRVDARRPPGGLKPKDLVMIPFRVALAAQADGWWVRSVIIWSKPNPMPESVRDRPTTAHEYVFLLTKSKTYFYDADAIREPCTMTPQARLTPRDMKNGKDSQRAVHRRPQYQLRDEPGVEGNPLGRNKRTVWEIATAPYPGAHYATFPPKLVEPMILTTPTKVCAECGAGWERVVQKPDMKERPKRNQQKYGAERINVGWGDYPQSAGQEWQKWRNENPDVTLGFRPTCSCDAETKPAVILDPFCGRGTVLKEARAHGRDWIGIDVDPQSIKLAEEWLGLGEVTYEIDEEHWIQPQLVNEESAQ